MGKSWMIKSGGGVILREITVKLDRVTHPPEAPTQWLPCFLRGRSPSTSGSHKHARRPWDHARWALGARHKVWWGSVLEEERNREIRTQPMQRDPSEGL